MKVIQIAEFGEPAVLRVAERPEPRPGAGEVLIEVKAAGVNYADVLMRSGRYGPRPFPFVPGFEAAGVVLEAGQGVTDWKPGQRAMGTVLREVCGCYAEKAVMPAWLLMALPDGFTFEEGAAFSEVFIAAYLALQVFGRLQAGETVLIQAAGGGVGTAAVQLAHAAGARVFATASSDEKLQKVKALGADVLINYKNSDFQEAVKNATGGQGVDLVLESVGGEVFEKSLRCLRPLGRLVVYGSSSGKSAAVSVPDLTQGSFTVSGFSYGKLSVSHPDLIRECMKAVSAHLAQGKVRPVVGHTFPLTQAREAHESLGSRATYGKVVLIP